MFILSVKSSTEQGAYAVEDEEGKRVIFLFEEEDDAVRYAQQLEEQEDNEMDVIEVDDMLAVATCKRHQYKYSVITKNDIIIPPRIESK